jgi:hypothetical protein
MTNQNRIWRLSAYAGLALMAGPTAAYAYCPGADNTQPEYDPRYYSVSREFQRSLYVVRVKVVGETWLGENGKPKPLKPPFQFNGSRPWGFDPYIGAFYDLEVQTAYKGSPSHRIRVFSENSTARFWFDADSEHLLFVSKSRFDSPVGSRLTIDTCGNSAAFPKARSLASVVLKLAKKPR